MDHYVSQLLDVLADAGDGEALSWRDKRFSAHALAGLVRRAATALAANGVGASSAVAVLTVTNSPATVITRYAANLVGATVVHLRGVNAANPLDELPVAEQVAILRDTGTTMLVADEENLARARKLSRGNVGLLTWDELRAGKDEPVEALAPAGGVAVLSYSSGSTGVPKGIARGFDRLATVITQARMAPTHTMLVTTPASHAASSMVDGALASGGTVILHDGFVAADVLAAVARSRVNRLYIAPPHLYALLDEPSLATTDLSSIRELYYGGCVASPARLAAAVEAFGPVLYQIYGTAEGWMISLLTPPEHAKPELLGTVGKPLDFVEVTVRDPESRAALPDGTAGEITMRSPMLMDGYWGDPDLTARTIIDGWLHTGDIGYLDEQGYLHLIDRLAEMIKTNGTKVYPADVEKALLAHPSVSQVAVFGVRDADNLEHIHAVVVPRPGATPSGTELTDHVAAALSPAHQPSTVHIRSEIPLLDTGKPDKVRLRSEVSNGAR